METGWETKNCATLIKERILQGLVNTQVKRNQRDGLNIYKMILKGRVRDVALNPFFVGSC